MSDLFFLSYVSLRFHTLIWTWLLKEESTGARSISLTLFCNHSQADGLLSMVRKASWLAPNLWLARLD